VQHQPTVDAEIANLVDLHTDDTYRLQTATERLIDLNDEVLVAGAEKVYAEVRAMISRAVRDTWEAATDRAKADACCWSTDDHAELAADWYGVTPEQVADMATEHEVWPAFVADLRAGLALEAALQRLPVDVYWRVT
jgi:hypothetical protein